MSSSEVTPGSGADAEASPPGRTVLLRIVLMVLAARAGLQVIGSLAVSIRGGLRAPSDLLRLWVAWDAHAYLRVAEEGYPQHGQDALDIVFFPLYPLIVRGASFVLRDLILSALTVSTIAAAGAGWFLYRLVRLDADHAEAQRSVVLMFAFPTAYYLFAPYTESLFLLGVLASMYAARKGSWPVAGMWGAAATATRFSGVFLLPALAVEALAGRPNLPRFMRRAAWSALAAVGILAYLGINVVVHGDPFAFVGAQGSNWSNRPAWPWFPLARAVEGLVTTSPGPDRLIIYWGRLTATACAVVLLAAGWRRLRSADQVYGWIGLLLLLSSAWLISLPRYLMGLYPIFAMLGYVSRRRITFWVIVGVSVVLQGALFWRYALRLWTF